jgi:N-acetylneuraminate synthase
MVREYAFTPEQHREIQAYCDENDVVFSSSCFSPEEADLLDEMGVPFFKIASMDVNNRELLDHVARKGKPMIVSTGMATMGEIEAAVHTVQDAGNDQLVLLHCVAVYPPDMEIMNLRNIDTLRRAFGVPVGFSDHTLGTAIPLAAIARGACVVEKHFTIDKDLPGWDHAISADEEDMTRLVESGRDVFTALGSSVREVSDAEMTKRRSFRRSVVAQRPLAEGDSIRREDVAFKRPGDGISVDEFEYVEGRVLTRDVEEGHVIRWHHVRGAKE